MLGDRYNGLLTLLDKAGSIQGRKMLQKVVYLAKEMGYPELHERFDYHWYGPYSETLANEVQELRHLGALVESSEQTAHGYTTYTYSLTERAQKLLKGKTVSDKHEALIKRLVKHNARFLELAATLHYFTKNGYSFADAKAEIKKAKEEQGYTSAEFGQARGFLSDLQSSLA